MKLFLALSLAQQTKNELMEQLDVLYKEYAQFNWVPSENYHITIFYFGEIIDPNRIYDRIETIVYDKKSFYMYAFHMDMFINHWITIYLDFRREKTLEAIAMQTREVFQSNRNHQRFVPHLTLSKWRIPSKQQYFVLKKRIWKHQVDLSFLADKITLFESIPSRRFPEYKKIKEFSLL